MYTETLVKLLPHLFFREMEWLHILVLPFLSSVFHFPLLQRMRTALDGKV